MGVDCIGLDHCLSIYFSNTCIKKHGLIRSIAKRTM